MCKDIFVLFTVQDKFQHKNARRESFSSFDTMVVSSYFLQKFQSQRGEEDRDMGIKSVAFYYAATGAVVKSNFDTGASQK